MPSDHDADDAPPAGWRLRVAESNIAELRRDLGRHIRDDEKWKRLHDRRVTVLEVRIATWAAIGGLIGGGLVALAVHYLTRGASTN